MALALQSRSSMKRHLLGWLLLSALVPGVTLTFGCGIEGERAATGECPADEVCSDATPDGLIFEGTRVTGTLLGGTDFAPVAVGGTMRVSIHAVGDRSLPAFDAATSSIALAVEGIVGNTVEVRGVASGSGLLRVLERAGGGLLDRTTLTASPIDRAVTAPTGDLAIALATERRATVFAPGEHEVAVHLLDASGRIVIDEGMTIDAGVPSTIVTWDAITVTVPETGLDLAVDAGAGSSFTARVDVAGPIDDVELATWLMAEGDDGRPEVGRGGSVCALALSAEAWVVSAAPPASRFALGELELVSEESSPTTHCARIPASAAPGLAELTVEIGPASRTFPISILPDADSSSSALISSGAGARGSVDVRTSSRALGDRARSALSR